MATAKAILKISLGMNGNSPACIALSNPIKEPRYKIPKVKIINEPKSRAIIVLKYDDPYPKFAK